jgi:hypothetical protein
LFHAQQNAGATCPALQRLRNASSLKKKIKERLLEEIMKKNAAERLLHEEVIRSYFLNIVT